jgi:hypothetical protein
LEWNKRIFKSSSGSRAANLYYHILHLYNCWIGSPSGLKHLLVVDVVLTSQPSMVVLSIPATRVSQLDGVPLSDMAEDEDLLD